MSKTVGTTFCPYPDEAQLLAACRSGDTSAFEQVVLQHQRGLYNIALRISGNEADAAEIVQETFLAAWRKIGEFRGESKLSTWLTGIAVNQARTRWQQTRRKRGREASLDDPADEEGGPLQVASEQPSALERLEQEQLRELLKRCIEALDTAFREVLVLRDVRELSYDEVGQALGVREGTVKSRLFRAREAVRDCVVKGMR